MKKIVSLLLILVFLLVFSCAVNAEDFKLHSNVTFGMTRDEVKKAEEANGFSCFDKKMDYTYYSDDGRYLGETITGYEVNGSIAGIDDSKIYYYFDYYTGKLFEVVYVFKGGNALSAGGKANYDILDQFETIQNQLEKKYSSVWIDTSEEKHPTSLHTFTQPNNIKVAIANRHKVRVNENECVFIDHWLTYMDIASLDILETDDEFYISGQHYIGYRLIHDSDLESQEAALQEKEQREKEEQERLEQEKEDQLANDL